MSLPSTRPPSRAWSPWVNVVLAVALIVVSYLNSSTEHYAFSCSNMATGWVLLVSSLLAFASSNEAVAPLPSWVNLVLGIWLVVSSGMAHARVLSQMNVIFGLMCVADAIVAMHEHTHVLRLQRLSPLSAGRPSS